MTEDIVEYEFEELEDGTPVGVSTIVGDDSTFIAGEHKHETQKGYQRQRLTDDFNNIGVAIPGERYIVDDGKFDHVLNEDYEVIEKGKYGSIEMITDDPDIDGRRGRNNLLLNALQEEHGERFDLTAVYVGHGFGGFDDSILIDDGEEVVEAVYLGDLGLESVNW